MANSSTGSSWTKIVVFLIIALALGSGLWFIYGQGASFIESLKRIASIFTFNIIRNTLIIWLIITVGIVLHNKFSEKDKGHDKFLYVLLFLICFIVASLGGDDLNKTLFGGEDGTYTKDDQTMYGILLPSVQGKEDTVYPLVALLLTAFLTWSTISALEYAGEQATGRKKDPQEARGFFWIKLFISVLISIGAARRGVMLATLGTWGYFLAFFFVYRFTLVGFPKEGAGYSKTAKTMALCVAIILTEYVAELIVGPKSTPPFLPEDPALKIIIAIAIGFGSQLIIRYGPPVTRRVGTIIKNKLPWIDNTDDLEQARARAAQQAAQAAASASGGSGNG